MIRVCVYLVYLTNCSLSHKPYFVAEGYWCHQLVVVGGHVPDDVLLVNLSLRLLLQKYGNIEIIFMR